MAGADAAVHFDVFRHSDRIVEFWGCLIAVIN